MDFSTLDAAHEPHLLVRPLVSELASQTEKPDATLESDDFQPPSADAAEIWEELVARRMLIAGHIVEEAHVSLLVTRGNYGDRSDLVAYAARLERVLTGCPQKVLAYDCDVAASTVSQWARQTLHHFGLQCTIRRAPLALVMVAACHAAGRTGAPLMYEERIRSDGSYELRLPRPEAILRPSLTDAEYEVLRAVVTGDSHSSVGRLRHRSPRTVANQLRSIADKLGVCGRFQYVELAVRLSMTRGLPAAPPAPGGN